MKKSRWVRFKIKIRSILYCFGRSNKKYYDHSIKHPAVFNEHFSWIVFLCYWVQFWLMVYWLTVIYFFRFQFIGWAKETAIEAFFLWTVPIYFTLDWFILPPFWALTSILDPIYYRNVNILKWQSDWFIISWGQYYVFYRYFKPVRYFFYLKIFWVEFWWALENTIDSLGYAREDYDGYYTKKMRAKWRRLDAAELRNKRFGTPMPEEFSGKHKKSRVLINKEIFYPDKLHYYTNYRTIVTRKDLYYFKIKNWWR